MRPSQKFALLSSLLLLTALLPMRTQAQLDAGILLGVSTYEGELTPRSLGTQLQQLGPSAGAFGRYQFSPYTALRVQYQFMQIEGADADRQSSRERNLSFFSDLHEVGVALEFYPLSTDRRISPYVSIGGAAVAYNPKTISSVGEVALREIGTEGQGIEGFGAKYGRWAGALPLGLGLRADLSPRLILGVEAVGRVTNTDYLDDLSRLRYVSEELLFENGPLAVELAWRTDEISNSPVDQSPSPGSQRGNPETNDFYLSGQVTLSYRFGESKTINKRSARNRTVDCPKF